MKKLMSLLVCLAMLLALIPAISVAEDTDLRVVRILAINDYDATVKTADWMNYEVSQVLIDALAERGIAIEIEAVDRPSFDNIVRTRMAVQTDLPDLVSAAFSGISAQEVLDWADAGLVMNVTELLEKYDDDGSIMEYYETYCPGARSSNAALDGNLYWFSYLAAPQQYNKETGEKYVPGWMNGHTPSIRWDWLQKIDAEYKYVYSPEELIDLLVAFQENDVNGNGQRDEVLNVKIDSFANGMATAFGLHTGLVAAYNSDNVVTSNFANPNFPAYIEFLKQCYDLGLYDTASLTAFNQLTDELITSNRAAVVHCYSGWVDYEPQIDDPDAAYAPFILDEDGDPTTGYTYTPDFNFGTYNYYFIPSTCEDPERVVDLMDYVYTNEYAMLDMWGREGINYELDEYGIPVNILTGVDMSDLENLHKYARFFMPAGLYGLPAINTTSGYSGIVDYTQEDWVVRKSEFNVYLNNDIRPYMNIIYMGTQYAMSQPEEAERLDEISTELETYCSELLTGLVLGSNSLDQMDAYLDEMNALGLQDYIDIQQARRDRFLALSAD